MRVPPRAAALIMGITPIVAIWMFFATYRVMSTSWIWLVAIPTVGVLVYGPTMGERD